MVIDGDGKLFSWGCNRYGQLGIGNTTDSTTMQIHDLSNVKSIACGSNHSMALDEDGQLFAWGYNLDGQLGNGNTISIGSLTPQLIFTLTNIKFIACGSNHSMAIDEDGQLFSWGCNRYGQLGIGNTSNSSTPIKILNLMNVKVVSCGSDHSIAINGDGQLFSWGDNEYGQLGIGKSNGQRVSLLNRKIRLSPHTIIIPANIKSISCGFHHSMAIDENGQLFSWGCNRYGQLGIGNTSDSSTPQLISTLTNIKSIACGYRHSMAINEDGQLFSWGSNSCGELGNGNTINSETPQKIHLDQENIWWKSEKKAFFWEFQRIIWIGKFTRGIK